MQKNLPPEKIALTTNPKGTESQHGERLITIYYWRRPRVERREALPQRSTAGLSLLSAQVTTMLDCKTCK